MEKHSTQPPWGWSVCGLGRAARARSAALEALPQATPRFQVSRRPEVGNSTFADVLADPGTHCVAICTENRDHPRRARECLQAGKHVLVEYPLAPTAVEVRALFDLAERVDRVLHVGLIGLLTARHAAVSRVVETQQVYGIELSLTGGYSGWLAEEAREGHYGQLAISRIHTLWDWVGPISLHRARCDRRVDGYVLHLEFRDTARRIHRITERRVEGAARTKSVLVKDPRGMAIDIGASGKTQGVFVRDTAHFHERIQGAVPRVTNETIIAVAALAEAVSLRVGTPC